MTEAIDHSDLPEVPEAGAGGGTSTVTVPLGLAATGPVDGNAGCLTRTVQPSSSSSRAMTCTSRMSGTFVTTVRPPASIDAAISFMALFLAPPTYAVPRSGWESGPWDRTWKPCTDPMLVPGRRSGRSGSRMRRAHSGPARSDRAARGS